MRSLGRTVTPYVSDAIGPLIGSIALGAIWLMTAEQRVVYLLPVPWLLVSVQWYFTWRYQIDWNDDLLRQRVSGSSDVEIRFADIETVRTETSVAMRRPLRRIVVAGRTAHVDISPRHFVRRDINNLLAAIRARRPDLSLPTVA
jgi:hypothetical protein